MNPSATAKEREAFRKRLARATRWYEIAQGLGWGVFALIPHEHFSNSWVEQTTRAWGLHVWIDLVKKERPDVCAVSRVLDSWLGPEGILGGPISGKQTLSIELDIPTYPVVTGVDDSEDDEVGEDIQALQTQAPSKSHSTPSQNMCQMSLLELFRPVA